MKRRREGSGAPITIHHAAPNSIVTLAAYLGTKVRVVLSPAAINGVRLVDLAQHVYHLAQHVLLVIL
jgi:hypothetical protein